MSASLRKPLSSNRATSDLLTKKEKDAVDSFVKAIINHAKKKFADECKRFLKEHK